MKEAYSRKAYERASEELESAEVKQKEQLRERLAAPNPLENHAVMTYQLVQNALDFLKGDSYGQAKQKLEDLRAKARDEAEQLNNRHEKLKAAVAEAASKLDRAVVDLKSFEKESLGI